MPLLERERELRAADALLADAAHDRGRLLCIEAPPGMGKSALVEHIAGRARDAGCVVLSAAGRELERGLGWGVARSLFESAVARCSAQERDELLSGSAAAAGALFGGEFDTEGRSPDDLRFAILHGLYWLAVRLAEAAPLVLIVDDAHWADEPSLRFLSYLQSRIREHPVAVLVAARVDEPGEAGLLAHLVAGPDTTVHELTPLSPAAVADLIRGRVPDADDALCRRCAELTAGNPLGVRELGWALADGDATDLDASAEQAARSLARSTRQRLRALPPDAGALAEAVAVFEGGVTLDRAAALADLSGDEALGAADHLSRAHILAAGDPLEFSHPLLRAAVYGGLTRQRTAALHRRAAALLLAARVPGEQVAAHLLLTVPEGDPAVVDALRGAARHASEQGVTRSAVAYLERALREPPADGARVQVLAELARAEAHAAPRRAIEHFEAAIAETFDPAHRAALALELGRALHDAGRLEEACRAFERGLDELAGRGGELVVELEAWYLTSAVLLPARAPDAHRRVDAILEHPGQTSSPAQRALMSKALIMRMYAGEPRDGLVSFARELYAGGRLLDEGGLASQAVGHVAGALSYCDEYAAAEDVLGRALEVTRRSGWVTWVGAASQLRARQRLWTGPIPDAVEDARTAVEIFTGGMQLYLPAAAHCLIRALIERDEPEAAEALYARVERDTAPAGIFAAWQHESRARLAAHRGDHARALEAFLACGEQLAGLLIVNPSMFHWRVEAGLAALRLGRREDAERLIAEEAALAEHFGAPRALGVARRAAALLERGPAAEDGLHSAAACFAGCGARVEHAHTLVELGAAIRRDGRPVDAREILREALRQAEADRGGHGRAACPGRDRPRRRTGAGPSRRRW